VEGKWRIRHALRRDADRHAGEGQGESSHDGLAGQEGTIAKRWGDPAYSALDVDLDDGRSELFWHYELEEIGQRA
jgi:hypothetical protein